MATANTCTPGHSCASENVTGGKPSCSGTADVPAQSRSRKPAVYGVREWLKDVEDDLAKLHRKREQHPKAYARHKAQYDRWETQLESRIAALRAEMEAIDAHA